MANFQVKLFTLCWTLNDSLALEKGFPPTMDQEQCDISTVPQGSKTGLSNLDQSSLGVVMPCQMGHQKMPFSIDLDQRK